ncbi:PAS/PAC sensor signal transduction histidine kinase [Bacillus methanolicus PB1]|uniref:PAS/PAC sensor signal transduction histidine kinase n=1 Tax=Bacillus methanolicus PB1 TaxID=997296 RepID=I3E095_BACMT|nr:PAS domain S-box protein [Bacillus methanolicus]EIJ79916.1 PAS/PAC sensor signal transduction histidine kinase [Bacillus methanolicus PB1]
MEILRSQFMTNENIVIFVLLAGVLFYIKILFLTKLLFQKRKNMEYKSLYFNHSFAIFTLDLNGNIIDTNPAAEELTGYKKGELVKRPFSNLLTSKSLTIQTLQFNDSLIGKSNEYSVSSIRKNGIEQTLFIKTIPIIKRKKQMASF